MVQGGEVHGILGRFLESSTFTEYLATRPLTPAEAEAEVMPFTQYWRGLVVSLPLAPLLAVRKTVTGRV